METQPYTPNKARLLELGFTHQIDATSENGAAYTAYINAPEVWQATRLYCKWKESGLYQVAHKEKGEEGRFWKFKGFGNFRDEAHFLKLLDMPPVIMVDALGDFLNNT